MHHHATLVTFVLRRGLRLQQVPAKLSAVHNPVMTPMLQKLSQDTSKLLQAMPQTC
jgi:hypothetical protein